jgi:hypothetical protein
MGLRTIVAAASAAAALGTAAGTAGGAYEPAAYGTAQSGTLNVTSGALVLRKAAELKGVWLDDSLPCSEQRTLEVHVEVFFTPRSGPGRRKKLSKTGAVANCAEGGPNFGFLFRPRRYGMGCRNGAWKRGDYSFLTTTKDTTSGLTASASLLWQKTTSC